MLHVIQANREEIARRREAWPNAGVVRHLRQHREVDILQTFDEAGRDGRRIDLVNYARQIAMRTRRIDDSGFSPQPNGPNRNSFMQSPSKGMNIFRRSTNPPSQAVLQLIRTTEQRSSSCRSERGIGERATRECLERCLIGCLDKDHSIDLLVRMASQLQFAGRLCVRARAFQ